MNNLAPAAKKQIELYINKLKASGYLIQEPVLSQYCYESVITDGKDKIKLQVYFGKKGIKSILQGNKESGCYQKVNQALFGESLFEEAVPGDLTEPEEYIGTDESGKGDYFGPLVIAGVGVDIQTKAELKKLGVKDSKAVAHTSIKKLAIEIKNIVKDNFNIVVVTPPTYNKLLLEFKNLNKLLAWGHAKVLENILVKRNYREAISDKFGDESLIKNSLQAKGKELLLHQRTKAERFTAVAAASIIARDKLNDWFTMQSKIYSMDIPKGASLKVEEAAKLIKGKLGEEKLKELVKFHFKTTGKL